MKKLREQWGFGPLFALEALWLHWRTLRNEF